MTATAAGGTHPTRMHSCYVCCSFFFSLSLSLSPRVNRPFVASTVQLIVQNLQVKITFSFAYDEFE